MSLQVKLFGKLKKKLTQNLSETGYPFKLSLTMNKIKRVKDILKKLEFQKEEVSHIFINGVFSKIDDDLDKAIFYAVLNDKIKF